MIEGRVAGKREKCYYFRRLLQPIVLREMDRSFQAQRQDMSTRAIQYLNQQGADFQVVSYRYSQKGALAVAQATGFSLKKIIKTLVLQLTPGKFCFVLIPGDRSLNLKCLAKYVGAKRAVMADVATAQRLTGYLVGGISPFGSHRTLTAFMEESILAFDQVMINGGRRGVMLLMAPADIRSLLGCGTAAFSAT